MSRLVREETVLNAKSGRLVDNSAGGVFGKVSGSTNIQQLVGIIVAKHEVVELKQVTQGGTWTEGLKGRGAFHPPRSKDSGYRSERRD